PPPPPPERFSGESSGQNQKRFLSPDLYDPLCHSPPRAATASHTTTTSPPPSTPQPAPHFVATTATLVTITSSTPSPSLRHLLTTPCSHHINQQLKSVCSCGKLHHKGAFGCDCTKRVRLVCLEPERGVCFGVSTQQDIYAAGSESRPPMHNKENYVPWSSRLLWYAKSRPNGKLINNSILNGPYVRKMILEPGDANREITVTETFHLQTDDELSNKELKQIEAGDQAIQTILLCLSEDIYAAVNSCETAQEIWL
nr:hypothetical protein [Tanacetum cinerariifolium]